MGKIPLALGFLYAVLIVVLLSRVVSGRVSAIRLYRFQVIAFSFTLSI